MYYMDGGNKRDRRIIFSKEIGLAIEEPPNGMTLADLWNPLWVEHNNRLSWIVSLYSVLTAHNMFAILLVVGSMILNRKKPDINKNYTYQALYCSQEMFVSRTATLKGIDFTQNILVNLSICRRQVEHSAAVRLG